MATLTIEVPDALVPRVKAALVGTHPHVDIDGLTSGQAARKIILYMIRSTVVNWENNVNQNTAMQDAFALAETQKAQVEADAETIV